MPRTFDLDDGGVVLVIGSGAGGGTLGNELAQKGVRTLILEAGPRIEREQLLDDERQSFAQLTWLDKRTTSGSWQIAKDSPSLPAWVCKVVGGTTVHWGRWPDASRTIGTTDRIANSSVAILCKQFTSACRS